MSMLRRFSILGAIASASLLACASGARADFYYDTTPVGTLGNGIVGFAQFANTGAIRVGGRHHGRPPERDLQPRHGAGHDLGDRRVVHGHRSVPRQYAHDDLQLVGDVHRHVFGRLLGDLFTDRDPQRLDRPSIR